MNFAIEPITSNESMTTRFQDVYVDLPENTTKGPLKIIAVQFVALDEKNGQIWDAYRSMPMLEGGQFSTLTTQIMAIVTNGSSKAAPYTAQIRVYCHNLTNLKLSENHNVGDPPPWPSNTGVVVVVATDDGSTKT